MVAIIIAMKTLRQSTPAFCAPRKPISPRID